MLTKPQHFLVISLLVALVIITTSCTKETNESIQKAEYVTFTYSKNATENTNGPIISEFWVYDSVTKETNKIFETEYTSQYPLGFYDKYDNQMYYTKNVNDGSVVGDQIFITDLNSNKQSQLTEDLFAVNYIYPVEKQVFFVARPQNGKVLRLGSINKATGEILYWGDENTVIEAMTVDQINQRIYVSTYSDKERRYNVMHQDGPAGQSNFKMPLHTVYETDFSFKQTTELFKEHEWIRTIMTNGSHVIGISDKQYNDPTTPSTLIDYNLTDETITKNPWHTNRLQVGDANYSSDGKTIYTISVVNNKRGLYAYDVESNEFAEIFTPESGFINNIQIVKP